MEDWETLAGGPGVRVARCYKRGHAHDFQLAQGIVMYGNAKGSCYTKVACITQVSYSFHNKSDVV